MCKELIASAKQEDTFIACLHVDVAKESQENPHRKVELVVQTDASDVDFLVKTISNIPSSLSQFHSGTLATDAMGFREPSSYRK